jgi:ribose transport system permease protein
MPEVVSRPSNGPARSESVQRAAQRAHRRHRLEKIVSSFGLLLLTLAMVGFFSILSPSSFGTAETFRSIADQNSVLLLLALAVLLPLAAGEFDLSVGANLGISQILVIDLQSRAGMGWPLAVLITLGAGAVIGIVNGWLVTRVKINSFIATLGTSTILAGLASWISHDEVIFEGISQGFTDLGRNQLAGIPLSFVYAIAVAIVLWLFLEFLPSGRSLYAAGGNPDAARLSGIRVDRLKAGSFVACGVISAFAGIVLAMRSGSASPSLGPEYLLSAYAATFLGATAVTVGRVNVWGTVLAMAFLAVSITGIQTEGAASWTQPVFYGIALLVAVALSTSLVKRLRAPAAAPDPEEEEPARVEPAA